MAERFYAIKISSKMSWKDIASQLGMSEDNINKYSRINNLSNREKAFVVKNKFSFRETLNWLNKRKKHNDSNDSF